MRWIVLVLFVVNLGLFAWFQTGGRAAVPAVTQPPGVKAVGERIELVSEVSVDALEAAAPAPAPKAPPVKSVADRLCTILGPFEEEYQGEDIEQRLQALQVDAELRNIEMQGQMRYWVYLEPLGSRREAFQRLRALQAEGVDSYVIPKGSLTNGISFGIFSEVERAESLAEELQERGIDALTREEPQTYLERWVVLPSGAEQQLAEDFWQQLQLEYPQLDRRQNLCREVESGAAQP